MGSVTKDVHFSLEQEPGTFHIPALMTFCQPGPNSYQFHSLPSHGQQLGDKYSRHERHSGFTHHRPAACVRTPDAQGFASTAHPTSHTSLPSLYSRSIMLLLRQTQPGRDRPSQRQPDSPSAWRRLACPSSFLASTETELGKAWGSAALGAALLCQQCPYDFLCSLPLILTPFL